jgi:glycosyltransferase involved in cell wall biosynthesis
VALEALSVGTPVIASNRGGLPEIVGKVDPKLIFRDFFELGNLLSSFHRDNLPSSRIREIYHKNFSPRAFIQKYIEAIHSLTG